MEYLSFLSPLLLKIFYAFSETWLISVTLETSNSNTITISCVFIPVHVCFWFKSVKASAQEVPLTAFLACLARYTHLLDRHHSCDMPYPGSMSGNIYVGLTLWRSKCGVRDTPQEGLGLQLEDAPGSRPPARQADGSGSQERILPASIGTPAVGCGLSSPRGTWTFL